MKEIKRIGIIGGSGLYEMEGLENIQELKVTTPFGAPSDKLIKGTLKVKDEVVELFFLPRHGKGHRILPSEINTRANIYALKKLGVKALVTVSAVGSMKQEIAPGDIVIVDQFIDRTKSIREHTFFGDGIVGHVSVADPVCPILTKALKKAAEGKGKIHHKGTYVTIEGPQFSTRAESNSYRQMGVDVIGMTACPEYKLAREAEIHFAVIALSTDYDCWKVDEAHVTVDDVIATMKSNVAKAKSIIHDLVPLLVTEWEKLTDCPCEHVLNGAVMTDPKTIPSETYSKLELLIGKYIKRS
jgi:5'-methylthioadenosine phosphorylase